VVRRRREGAGSAAAFVVAAEAHAIPERAPLSLGAGEVVTVVHRDGEWPAFVFVAAARGSGWVPSRHLSADEGTAVVETPYDTTELATTGGEILEVVDRDDESGWLWCRSGDGREGWVPSRSVESPRPGPADPGDLDVPLDGTGTTC
jgi:uncharacterized protein YgiM (DUF1202 family)